MNMDMNMNMNFPWFIDDANPNAAETTTNTTKTASSSSSSEVAPEVPTTTSRTLIHQSPVDDAEATSPSTKVDVTDGGKSPDLLFPKSLLSRNVPFTTTDADADANPNTNLNPATDTDTSAAHQREQKETKDVHHHHHNLQGDVDRNENENVANREDVMALNETTHTSNTTANITIPSTSYASHDSYTSGDVIEETNSIASSLDEFDQLLDQSNHTTTTSLSTSSTRKPNPQQQQQQHRFHPHAQHPPTQSSNPTNPAYLQRQPFPFPQPQPYLLHPNPSSLTTTKPARKRHTREYMASNYLRNGAGRYVLKTLTHNRVFKEGSEGEDDYVHSVIDLALEAEILSRLNDHPNIIKIRGVMHAESYCERGFFIVLDRLYSTLSECIEGKWRKQMQIWSMMPWVMDCGGRKRNGLNAERLKVAYYIARALEHVHKHR